MTAGAPRPGFPLSPPPGGPRGARLSFQTFVSDVERHLGPLGDPTDPVPIAAAKAMDGPERSDAVVLAGDTIVVLRETP